jgi:nicotinate phosphoribosyltransferase
MLDEAGLRDVKIFASSGLDEYKIQTLVASGAPIDAFGVGTKLAVVADAPQLDMAYKLVEYGGKGRLKLSAKKVLYPGRKQVFRQVENGRLLRDVIGRFDEPLPGEPLLQPLIEHGQSAVRVDLNESRLRLKQQMEGLPEALRGLEQAPEPYPVSVSDRLQADFDDLSRELTPLSSQWPSSCE